MSLALDRLPTRRLRATVEYDGSDFAGWQRQKGRRSVQGALESALAQVHGQELRVVGSGRTDAGVHAVGQVAHFDTPWVRSIDELLRAVNAVLPRDVAVLDIAAAPEGFHARYSAVARAYAYTLWVRPIRSPLERRSSLHLPKALALDRMVEAASHFVGTHDFAAFGRPMQPGGATLRRLDRFGLRQEGPRICIEVVGNAFLRHQVRRMVGVLIDVGRGHCEPGAIAMALAGEHAAVKPRRVPAQGLVLTAVHYPPDEDMQLRTRAGLEQGVAYGEDV